MSCKVLDRWCERGILALVIAILVVTPLAFGGRPQSAVGCRLDFLLLDPFFVAHWLAIAVCALWLCRIWLTPNRPFLWPPISWAVLAFVAYAIGRYWYADIEYVARQELIRILVYAFLFFAIINNLQRQDSAQIVSFTLIFLAMALSFYAIYQFLTGSSRVWHLVSGYSYRGSGTYISPNHLSGFLEMLLPLGLAYTLVGRLKPVGKVLLGYASLVILAGITVTISRGSWASAAFSLILFFSILALRRTHRLPSFILLVVMIGGGVLLLPKSYFIQARFKNMFSQTGVNDDMRFSLWQPAVRIWQDHPWWGVGPDHFDYRFRQYRPDLVQARPDRVHNDFLNTLADWGAVGAALVASAWVLLVFGIRKTWSSVLSAQRDLGGKTHSNKFAFFLGASMGLVAIFVHSMVDYNMHVPANALLAVALMALLSSQIRFATDRFWAKGALLARAVASAALLAGIAYLGWQGWRHASENASLARAALAPNFSSAKIEWLTKAFAAEPMNPETAWAVGEAFRVQSSEGGRNYQELATRAIDWFGRSIKLNPWEALGYLRYGWCLDWLGRTAESAPYFDRADQVDPNGYFTMANIGLHYVELRDYAAAKPWLERSSRLQWQDNPIAANYLNIVNLKLLEAATNDLGASLDFPLP